MTSNPNAVEKTELMTIEGDGVEFEATKETKRSNSLADSQAIQMIVEMDKELVIVSREASN